MVSPWCRRGVVDSTPYTTCSMLRTIELILGLEPLSQFDAAATPMRASFQARPDPGAWTARPARVNLDERNPGGTPAAGISPPSISPAKTPWTSRRSTASSGRWYAARTARCLRRCTRRLCARCRGRPTTTIEPASRRLEIKARFGCFRIGRG